MQESSFEEVIEEISQSDARYHRDAYLFVRRALDYTQKKLVKSAGHDPRHVTGQELLNGIREFALAQFGPMTPMIFEEWGIQRCEDFGEIVFNMVESGLLAKTDKDDRSHFKKGYDFVDAFQTPYLPSNKMAGCRTASAKPSRSSASKPTNV